MQALLPSKFAYSPLRLFHEARTLKQFRFLRGSSLCMGAIFGSAQAVNFAIVGDVFLKNWYSVYDARGNRVGLAKSNQ